MDTDINSHAVETIMESYANTKHDWEVGTVASLLSKMGMGELASAVVRWVPNISKLCHGHRSNRFGGNL